MSEGANSCYLHNHFHSPYGASGLDVDNNEVIAPLYAHVRMMTGNMANTKNNLRF